MTRRSWRSTLAGLALAAAVTPVAQAEEACPDFTVHVQVKGVKTVTDSGEVRVRMNNFSPQTIVVIAATVRLPDTMVTVGRSSKIPLLQKEYSIKPHSQWNPAPVTIPAVSFIDAWSLLLLRHEPRSFTIDVTYQLLSGDTRERGATYDQELQTMLAPWWAVACGGALGVVLAVVFRMLYARWRGAIAATRPHPPAWVAVALGWIVVTLATLVLRFSAHELPKLPISIEIKDFYGGLLLGLVFEPLTAWLGGLIGLNPDPHRRDRAEGMDRIGAD